MKQNVLAEWGYCCFSLVNSFPWNRFFMESDSSFSPIDVWIIQSLTLKHFQACHVNLVWFVNIILNNVFGYFWVAKLCYGVCWFLAYSTPFQYCCHCFQKSKWGKRHFFARTKEKRGGSPVCGWVHFWSQSCICSFYMKNRKKFGLYCTYYL